MTWLSALWLILLGVLAVPSLILSKKPNAKEMLDKLAPYQGWIGAVSALWGVWGIISFLRTMGFWTSFWPIMGYTTLAASIVQLILGFMLGIGVMKTFVKNEAAQKKMDDTLAKMAPKQGLFGIVAIALGGWMIIVSLFFKPSVSSGLGGALKALQNLAN